MLKLLELSGVTMLLGWGLCSNGLRRSALVVVLVVCITELVGKSKFGRFSSETRRPCASNTWCSRLHTSVALCLHEWHVRTVVRLSVELLAENFLGLRNIFGFMGKFWEVSGSKSLSDPNFLLIFYPKSGKMSKNLQINRFLNRFEPKGGCSSVVTHF